MVLTFRVSGVDHSINEVVRSLENKMLKRKMTDPRTCTRTNTHTNTLTPKYTNSRTHPCTHIYTHIHQNTSASSNKHALALTLVPSHAPALTCYRTLIPAPTHPHALTLTCTQHTLTSIFCYNEVNYLQTPTNTCNKKITNWCRIFLYHALPTCAQCCKKRARIGRPA